MRKRISALAAAALIAAAAGTMVSDARAEGADVQRETRCTFFIREAGGFFIGETIALVRTPDGAVTFTCRADSPPGVIEPDGALVIEIECFFGGRFGDGRVIVTPEGDLLGHCTVPA